MKSLGVLIGQMLYEGAMPIARAETVDNSWRPEQLVTFHIPTKQPHRKTGIAQARRAAKKRKNQK